MKFTFTYPMHSHPYNPELVTGSGIATVAGAAEAAGFHGFGFTDHPAPTQRWLESGGHDALDHGGLGRCGGHDACEEGSGDQALKAGSGGQARRVIALPA